MNVSSLKFLRGLVTLFQVLFIGICCLGIGSCIFGLISEGFFPGILGVLIGSIIMGAAIYAVGEKIKDKLPVPTFFQIKILSAGESQLELIKIICNNLGLGLKETFDLVQTKPCILPRKYSREEAEQLGVKISSTGATYQILPVDDKQIN